MRRVFLLTLAVLVILCRRPCSVRAFSLSDSAEKELDEAVREARIPVLAIAIVDEEGIVFENIYGSDADVDTPFLLGSISKSFTALCIMCLAEENMLSLDDPVSMYIDGTPDGMMIRQLLNHTSGYGTYQTDPEEAPQHSPGKHVYSNLNYALLADVIEAVSGQTYEEYLQSHILGPLGMDHTSSVSAEAQSNGLVRQYENWFGFPVAAEPHFPEDGDWIQPGAGYISSGLADMASYLQMYINGGEGVVPADRIEDMFMQTVPAEGETPYSCGFEWTVSDAAPLTQTVYWHSGLVETAMTCMYILPEEKLGIIIMTDMNDYFVGTDLMYRMGWNLILRIMGAEPGRIEPGEYWRRRGLINLAYAASAAACAVPLITLRRFRKRAAAATYTKRLWITTTITCIALPLFLLLLPDTVFGTPLRVVAAFVPDLHLVLWMSAVLLLAAGIVRCVVLARVRQQ